MSDENELKPCPFCGGTNQIIEGEDTGSEYFICDCGADGPGGDDGSMAIKRWNTRAADPVKADLLAALKALFENEHIQVLRLGPKLSLMVKPPSPGLKRR